MQKNLKKILCLLLTMVMVLGMIPFSAFASEAQAASDLPTAMAGLSIAYPYNTETVQLTGAPADRFDALTFESARGEVESAQLILTPDFAVDSFELTMNSLKNEKGNIIPSWAFEVYTQHYVTVSGSGNAANYSDKYSMYNPTYNTKGYDGTFPDALIPQDAAIEKGENKIAAGNNQGIWVNLNVQSAAPGTYTGSATLTINGSAMQIPVSVHIYDVAITEEVHATNFIAIWWDMVQFGEGQINRELADTYFEYLLSKRITPMEAWNVNRWDSSMAEAITGWAKDPRITSYLIQHQKGEDGIFDAEAMKTTLTTLVNKQLEVGGEVDLFKKGYFYIYDEPRDDKEYAISNQITAQLDAIKAELAPLLAAYPAIQESFLALRQVVTAPNPTDKTYSKVGSFWNYFINDDYGSTVLTGDSYMYVPQYQWFQNADQRALYADEAEVWWYGCCHPISPYPTYHLNTPLVSSRVESWMRYAYGIDGFLYSAANRWGEYDANSVIQAFDYWNSYNGNGTPGDMILTYPGSAYGVEGPIGSIRLENIREGQEDYEYLWLLENVYGSDISAYTANLFDGVIPDTDASIHYNNRKALLAKLEQLNVAANGATEIAPGQEGFVRGVALTPGVNQQIDVAATEEFDLLSFDYKVTGGNKIDLALLSDWSNYFGYYQFGANGAMASYPGINVIKLDDGYFRVIFDMDELTYKAGEPSTLIDFFFLRNTSDAEGYVDNVRFGMHGDPELDIPATEPEPTEPETEAPTEPPVVEKPTIFEGAQFTTAGFTINLDNDKSVTKMSFDYKLSGDGNFSIALLPSWSAYYGYFKLDAAGGTAYTYAGVTTEAIADGYIRVYIDMAAVTSKQGTPSDVITMLYIRGGAGYTTADGQITNIRINESAYDAPRGDRFAAGVNKSIDLDATEEIALLSFDYKISSGSHFQMALLPNWSSYFGYFKFLSTGAEGAYEGITTEALDDGYIRVTMELDKLTKMAGTPSAIIDFMYIRGDWTTANGYIDNIQYTLKKDMPRGVQIVAGEKPSLDLDVTEEIGLISFDYKLTSDGHFNIGLLPNWSSYFGYFKFFANGPETAYAGMTTETLEDGYIRVTMELDKLNQMAGSPSKIIDMLFINGGYTTANGYIDNIQYTLQKDMPRGQFFEAGKQTQIMINATEEVSQISFDYKITNDGDFDLALLPDWSSYFGYFGFLKDGAEGEYAGVTTEKLEDGYVHVTIEMDKLIHMAGTPSKVISFLYLRTDWGNGAGYIDNVQFTTHTHSYEAVVTAPDCLNAGYTTHTCSCGDSYVDSQVEALGHNYESVVTAPTPSAQGYTTHTCSRCGDSYVDSYTDYEVEGYLSLTEDMNVNLSLTEDFYVNLNGHNMTGTINTNGHKVYGIDTTTDDYTCENMGSFNCVDAEGNPVIPESNNKTELTGAIKRYLTIETQNGYTFHRFYVGITHMSLQPSATGVGYKAIFGGDDMVKAQLDATEGFGYTLWLEGNTPVTKGKGGDSFTSGRYVSLLLKNFDVENYSDSNVYAKVWIKLADGTLIESAEYTMTMKDLVENINDNYTAYSEEKLQAVRDMIAANPIMESWQVENILKQEVIRGEAFTAATNKTIALDNTEVLESISFEYKITDGSHFQIALLPDWSSFYGYFKMMADGPEGAYDGMTWETLEDGYIRVNIDIAAVTRMTGTPAATISMLFINGSYTTANGYIDNIQFQVKEPVYLEKTAAGAAFAVGETKSISIPEGAYDVVTFDYKFTSGTKLHVGLLQKNWAKYYGYFKLGANGVEGNYDGVTSEKLDNGYIRVTMHLADITMTNSANNANNAPETIAMMYIRGDWSDAAGEITNIRCLNEAEEEICEGAAFAAGETKSIYVTEGAYDVVTFDYKFTSGTKLHVGLLQGNWAKYYGYFKLGAEGVEGNYTGVTSEKLDNGYIRVTMHLADITMTNSANNANNAPETIAMMYIRGDWSDADGEITNIRCLSAVK